MEGVVRQWRQWRQLVWQASGGDGDGDAGDGERGPWCPCAHYVTAGKDQRRQGEDVCAVFRGKKSGREYGEGQVQRK